MSETIHGLDEQKFKELCPKWAHYAIAECPVGWHFIVYVLLKKFEFLENKGLMENFTVMQIKEKFLQLRFYWSGSAEVGIDMDREVDLVEDQSDNLCMSCGSIIDRYAYIRCKYCDSKKQQKL
jgi:hypothetical protein